MWLAGGIGVVAAVTPGCAFASLLTWLVLTLRPCPRGFPALFSAGPDRHVRRPGSHGYPCGLRTHSANPGLWARPSMRWRTGCLSSGWGSPGRVWVPLTQTLMALFLGGIIC